MGDADEAQPDLVWRQDALQGLNSCKVAARAQTYADLDAGQVLGAFDLRLGRDVDAARRHRVGLAPHAPVVAGGSRVDGPVAGAADLALAALAHGVERSVEDLVGAAVHGRLGARGAKVDVVDELVVEPFLAEVALLLGHPLLQAVVGNDPELRHRHLHTHHMEAP